MPKLPIKMFRTTCSECGVEMPVSELSKHMMDAHRHTYLESIMVQNATQNPVTEEPIEQKEVDALLGKKKKGK